jgi:hypothetical protein
MTTIIINYHNHNRHRLHHHLYLHHPHHRNMVSSDFCITQDIDNQSYCISSSILTTLLPMLKSSPLVSSWPNPSIYLLETIKARQELVKWREWRAEQLQQDKQYCHPRWPQESKLLDSEIQAVKGKYRGVVNFSFQLRVELGSSRRLSRWPPYRRLSLCG